MSKPLLAVIWRFLLLARARQNSPIVNYHYFPHFHLMKSTCMIYISRIRWYCLSIHTGSPIISTPCIFVSVCNLFGEHVAIVISRNYLED